MMRLTDELLREIYLGGYKHVLPQHARAMADEIMEFRKIMKYSTGTNATPNEIKIVGAIVERISKEMEEGDQ